MTFLTIGSYRVLEKLGAGGMGEVYLAEDTRLDRRVALKVLLEQAATDPERRERFAREARAAAALNHPHVVTIHSVEEDAGRLFLTMEYVEGKPLAARIPPRGLAIEELLSIAIPLADAVAAAHERGITHRDLKPANVLLTNDGRVKVLDFGLAKVREPAALSDTEAATATAPATIEGRILGTLAYMSPEQAEGKAVDHRSDLFSLGVLLYEAATGQRPFTGDTDVSVLSAILRDTPRPVTELRPDVPPPLARVIKRCLQKSPADRYQTARDLWSDLRLLQAELSSGEIVAAGSPGASSTRPGARSNARWIATIAIGVLALAALVAWRAGARRTSSPAPFASMRMKQLTDAGVAGNGHVSPDGRHVAYSMEEGDWESLWLLQVATGATTRILPPAEVVYLDLAFSPDGNFIYYSTLAVGGSACTLSRVAALGGAPMRLSGDACWVDVSPDGRLLAFIKNLPTESEVYVANPDGTGQRRLAARPGSMAFANVAWSPDGRSLAVLRAFENPQQSPRLVVFDPADGSQRELGDTGIYRGASGLLWLAAGFILDGDEDPQGDGSQLWLLSYPDLRKRRLTHDLNEYRVSSATADGRALLVTQESRYSNLWVVPATGGGTPRQLTSGRRALDGWAGLDWAPDGRLIFSSVAAGNDDIWAIGPDGGRQQLTFDAGMDIWPTASRDGRAIAFLSSRSGRREVWLMDADGTNQRQVSERGGRAPVFTSDSRSILFWDPVSRAAMRSGMAGGAIEPLLAEPTQRVSADPRQSSPPGFRALSVSPDGRWVAGSYQPSPDAEPKTAIVSMDGRAPWRGIDSVPGQLVIGSLRWTRDGRGIAYDAHEGRSSNIWVQPLDGGPRRALTSFTSDRIFGFAWSPDGRELAIARGGTLRDQVLISNEEGAGRAFK